MKIEEATEWHGVGDVYVAVALGVAQEALIVSVFPGDVDEDKSVALALLG